jgi:hypothetical protein
VARSRPERDSEDINAHHPQAPHAHTHTNNPCENNPGENDQNRAHERGDYQLDKEEKRQKQRQN